MMRLTSTLKVAAEEAEMDATLEFWRKIDRPLIDALLDPAHSPNGTILPTLVAKALGRSVRQLRDDMDFLAEALDAADLDWYRQEMGR